MTEIKARTPGRIIAVLVKAGDRFLARQTLAVLEAMKMEQPVFSREDGTVGEILVSEGDFVKQGQVLLTVEKVSGNEMI